MGEGRPRSIAPRLHERMRDVLRSPSRRRAALLRRTAASVLVVMALVLALAPAKGDVTGAVLVAARDLASGATLTEADVAVARWPVELIPAGALRGPADAGGRILAGAARAGEPLTDVRLAGPAPPGRTGDPRVAAVPVRLADPDVAGLLVPGSRVDVITPGPAADRPVVLAADAAVVTVVAAESDALGQARGRLVLVTLPRADAARVAAAALADQVTVTLR
jgi:pilus assembly protein CpaB